MNRASNSSTVGLKMRQPGPRMNPFKVTFNDIDLSYSAKGPALLSAFDSRVTTVNGRSLRTFSETWHGY
jgi:hypothetical protein